MPIEYELKFVLDDPKIEQDFINNDSFTQFVIKQGYLNKNCRIRSVLNTDMPISFRHVFTFKQEVNKKVIEIETDISRKDFDRLWSVIEDKNSLIKIRYTEKEPTNDNLWEIDFFKDIQGRTYFTMAECEMFGDLKTPFKIPDIIANNILFRVPKGDDDFSSRNLTNISRATRIYKKLLKKGKL